MKKLQTTLGESGKVPKKRKKINVLLQCKICEENVLVKDKYKYLRLCDCGNIEVDTHTDKILITKITKVKWKMKNEWIEFEEEEE